MELLWTEGQATVRAIAEKLVDGDPPAYTTVMTVMSRLAEKGMLERRLEGRAYVYRPTKSKEQFMAEKAQTVVREVLRDFGDVAVAHFLREMERIDPDRLRRLVELAEGKEREG
jgi:predicted transcriptional regulator